jgi:phosphoglycolate phosphatase
MGFNFLIFDLDGTLIDSLKDITTAINSIREKYGFEERLSGEQLRSYLGSGIDLLLKKAVSEKEGVKIDKMKIIEEFKFYYGKCLTNTTIIYDGVTEMLEALKGKKKAILSNKPESLCYEAVKRLGISDYFDVIWGGDSTSARKPDPKPVMDLIKHTASEISEAAMIGDSANDFLAAKAAGIPLIAVTYGYSDIEQIKQYNPEFIVETPKDIIDIVL